jgi:hypothetical protein
MILGLALVLAAQTARADDVHDYYEGERRSGWLWGGFGVAGLGGGIALAAAQKDFTGGLAGPLIGFGALQTTIGILSLARGPGRIRGIDGELAVDARAFRVRDLERIQKINRAFLALGVVESVLLVTGAIILGAGASRDVDSVRGVGLGIAIESGVMLFCDSLAHTRAERYESSLAK